ncbi:hypothetical protein KUTeg_013851 [Tegillarca granosa]|uniref:Transmembrane protein n=1 Tax=Tegillarca granosa TaxID=220873 RepID=A0ABQ9EUW5_TEGGR|nr:hypothetical protein KUTeg_013851 [Tegillarca granosa]
MRQKSGTRESSPSRNILVFDLMALFVTVLFISRFSQKFEIICIVIFFSIRRLQTFNVVTLVWCHGYGTSCSMGVFYKDKRHCGESQKVYDKLRQTNRVTELEEQTKA